MFSLPASGTMSTPARSDFVTPGGLQLLGAVNVHSAFGKRANRRRSRRAISVDPVPLKRSVTKSKPVSGSANAPTSSLKWSIARAKLGNGSIYRRRSPVKRDNVQKLQGACGAFKCVGSGLH